MGFTEYLRLCRKRKQRKRIDEVPYDPAILIEISSDGGITPDTVIEQNSLLEIFYECFTSLWTKNKLVLIMEGMQYSYQEIAAFLNVPDNTVASWIRRGRKKLKQCMEAKRSGAEDMTGPGLSPPLSGKQHKSERNTK